MSLSTQSIQCPFCGETIEIEVEDLGETQTYVEDCSVCCRPMQIEIFPGEDEPQVTVSRSE